MTGLMLVVIIRHGVLAMMVVAIWMRLCHTHPATLDFGAWYGHVGVAFLALHAAVALYGYRVASPAWARPANP